MKNHVKSVFRRSSRSTSEIMGMVLLALMPSLTAAVWYFGIRALMISLLSVGVCVGTEALWEKLFSRRITVSDLSAAVTGLLIALSLPVTTPPWAVIFADVIAIIAGKQLFGGVGQNIFNPALVGRGSLLLGAGAKVVDFVSPYDAVSSATPLASQQESICYLLMGNHAGSMGETCAVLLIFGFGILYCTGIVGLDAPMYMLGTLAILTLLFGGEKFLMGNAPYAILSGGALFGAFFMVTDYSSTPASPCGRRIFGIGAGLLTFIIRKWCPIPEGVCFSILIMNLFSPLIEELTAPAAYGKVGKIYERKNKASA